MTTSGAEGDLARAGDTGARAAAATAPYPPANYAWFVVFVLQLVYAIAYLDRQILSLLVEPIRADLKLTDTQFSLLVGVAFVTFYSTMGLVCGRLADTRNRRNLIIIGMIIWCLATAACGLARNFHEMFVARCLIGAGEAVLGPCAYSMIADYFSREKRAQAASIYASAVFIGGGASLLIGGAAIAATTDAPPLVLPYFGELRSWQTAFLLIGLPGLLVAALMLLVKEPVRREYNVDQTALKHTFAFIRKHYVIIGLIIGAMALNGLCTYSMNSWTPAVFIRNFGWTPAQIGMAQGIILAIFGTAGAALGGWWVTRSGAKHSNAVVLGTSRNALLPVPVLGLVFAFIPDVNVRLAAVAAIALCTGFPAGLAAAALYNVTPNQYRGQMLALYLMTGTLIGFGIGVTLVASITDFVFHDDQAVGKSLGLVVMAASIASATLMHIALRRPDRDYAQ